MAVEWCPTDEMTGYLLTKPNQGSIFKRFRDLIVGVVTQTDPNNGKQDNREKTKLRKVSKSKRRSGQRDRYHKRPRECIAD